MSNILDSISNEFKNIDAIRQRLIQPKKLKLHSGIEGFNSPDAYGIYRHTGGEALGVVGKQYEPADLDLFLTGIVESAIATGLDLSKLTYNEYCGGSKIIFDIPLQDFDIPSPMVGDTLATKLQFKTGFDGLTKVSLGFYAYRLWCANGAKSWKKDIGLSYKNTANNHAKSMAYSHEILKAIANVNEYQNSLKTLIETPVTAKQAEAFYLKLTGTSLQDAKEISTRRRNIMDAINNSVAIEMQNTGANLFSLLQGATRYTTHEAANGSEEKLMFASAAKTSDLAHQLIFEMVGN
jgi:hypothetical protein